MMAELHILRACMAIKNGRLTLDAALNEPGRLRFEALARTEFSGKMAR